MIQMTTTAELWGQGFRERIEGRLSAAMQTAQSGHCPPKLGEALSYAVFPGGGRIRSSLCLAVAKACGERNPQLADAVAAAVELLHCASLVHDDLACFDDATLRRGKLALHRVFGEPLAVLAGDGLVALAFQQLAETGKRGEGALAEMFVRLARSVGTAEGMVAGQAWELEPNVDLGLYHACKTGAIFEAAIVCGALASETEGEPWATLGKKLGQAFQAADDIADISANPAWLGKPTGRDSALGRPSVTLKLGLDQAPLLVDSLLSEALSSIPSCSAKESFREWLETTIIPMILQRMAQSQVPDSVA